MTVLKSHIYILQMFFHVRFLVDQSVNVQIHIYAWINRWFLLQFLALFPYSNSISNLYCVFGDNDSQNTIPGTHLGALDWVCNSWLWSLPRLTTVGIRWVIQLIKGLTVWISHKKSKNNSTLNIELIIHSIDWHLGEWQLISL